MPRARQYGRRWGHTRLERARRILRGPRAIRQVRDGYIVPSQRLPHQLQYHVYMTPDGPRCGRSSDTDPGTTEGCLDKFYRHNNVANCKHELAIRIAYPVSQRPVRAAARASGFASRRRPVPPRPRARGTPPRTRAQTRRERAANAYEERRALRRSARIRNRG